MKTICVLCLSVILCMFYPVFATGRTIVPLVSTEWLGQNIGSPGLVLLDIRKPEEYKGAHIPGAVNVFFGKLITERNKLLLELPEDKDLYDTIGSAGITKDSRVVIVNKIDTNFDRADAVRAAWTLIYAGVDNVALLDGGYNNWAKEKRDLSDKVVETVGVKYAGKTKKAMVVTKSYVLKRIGKTTIVDGRTPDDFFGITKVPFVSREGHIKGAVMLPLPWVFTKDGTFIARDDMEAMVHGVIGKNKSKEVIVYCGVGGYASAWWFLLHEVLGYTNVKVYDGSMQEWSGDPAMPITKYSWR